MLRRLPRRVERIASAVEHGRLTVNVRLFADERGRRYATGMLQQLLLTVLGATAGVMAVLLLGTAGGPAVTATVSFYQLLGYFLLVVSSVLVLRVLVLVFGRDQCRRGFGTRLPRIHSRRGCRCRARSAPTAAATGRCSPRGRRRPDRTWAAEGFGPGARSRGGRLWWRPLAAVGGVG